MFLVSAHLPAAVRPLRLVRVAAVTVLVFCVAFGSLMAQANYKANLPYNLEQADLSNWFARGQVSAKDLILTQFETSRYDNCEWIPLLTDAEVLYCRNAQVILTPDQNRDVQRLRKCSICTSTEKTTNGSRAALNSLELACTANSSRFVLPKN
jgi:hypothetical protein